MEVNNAREWQSTTQTMASLPGNGPSSIHIDGETFSSGWGVTGATHDTQRWGKGKTHGPFVWASMGLCVFPASFLLS